jgi:hypothetical protein
VLLGWRHAFGPPALAARPASAPARSPARAPRQRTTALRPWPPHGSRSPSPAYGWHAVAPTASPRLQVDRTAWSFLVPPILYSTRASSSRSGASGHRAIAATAYRRRCCTRVRFFAAIAPPPSAPPCAPSSCPHRQGEGANFGRPLFTAARRSSAPHGWAASIAFFPFFRVRQLRLVMLEL